MYVLTMDQRGSRKSKDHVPELLHTLAKVATVLPFTRTVGDEVQGLLDNPEQVVAALFSAWRLGHWSIGIGAGRVETPLGERAPESRGPAFIAAREAVERAKNSWFPLAVAAGATPSGEAGAQPADTRDALVHNCQTGLRLVGNLVAACTEGQWRYVDALLTRPETTQAQLAARFKVSQQAVSKSLRASVAAGIVEGRTMSLAQLATLEANTRG